MQGYTNFFDNFAAALRITHAFLFKQIGIREYLWHLKRHPFAFAKDITESLTLWGNAIIKNILFQFIRFLPSQELMGSTGFDSEIN